MKATVEDGIATAGSDIAKQRPVKRRQGKGQRDVREDMAGESDDEA